MGQDIGGRLKDIRTRLNSGEASPTPTVREFLTWVGAQRRGTAIVSELKYHLRKSGLQTSPDFEVVPMETIIEFIPRVQAPPPATENEGLLASDPKQPSPVLAESSAVLIDDPRQRVSRLPSANAAPLSIKPNASLQAALTEMMINDFSQLPVMTSERSVNGVVSWRSIGTRITTGTLDGEVRQFMDAAEIVDYDTPLLLVMQKVAMHDYVLVRDHTNKICGIVTTSDVHAQYRMLTEPFLLIGEIETGLRRMLEGLSREKLQAARDPSDSKRPVRGPADLSFGEYVRLFQDPNTWAELDIKLDRSVFVKTVEEVRKIRNDVMHFDPDGVPLASVERLRNLAQVLDFTIAMRVRA